MSSVPQPPIHARRSPFRIMLFVLLVAALVVPFAAAGASDDVELVGEVVLEHGEDFATERVEEFTVLETKRGRFLLEGAKARRLEAGTTVRVRGKRSGETVVLGADSSVTTVAASVAASSDSTNTAGSVSAASASTTAAAGTTINKKVAILLINFQNPPPSTPSPTPQPSIVPSAPPTATPSPTPSPPPTPTPPPPPQPWTKTAVRGLFFTNERSVASYYSEVSDGRMALTGEVFGYYTITAKTTSCNYSEWGTAARQAATAAGVNLSSYTNVVHAFPRQSACWWGGLAQVNNKYSWINGSMTIYVTTHELGHNFGAHHASSMSCTKSGSRVPLSSSCSVSEYGDPFDVMGQNASGPSNQRHMQTWHRKQTGILGTADQLTVTKNGRYTVSTAQKAGGSPRILRVKRTASDYYYLEYRQPYGLFDDFSTTSAAVNGVMVRIAPDTLRVQSKLLDMNPSTTTFSDAPLAVGKTFTDPSTNLSISTVSIKASGATLRIQIGPDTVPPTTPGNLTASMPTPTSVKLSWQASTDDLEVTGYRVKRDGVTLGKVSGTTYTDSAPLSVGVTYSYTVVALDGGVNASTPATVTFVMPDTTRPSAPTNVRAVQTAARSVGLSWTAASDNGVVVSYLVRRNGSLLAKTTSTSFTDTKAIDGFSYSYVIKAVDAAGNVGPGAAATPATISLPDVTAPSPPGKLSQVVASGSPKLQWLPATDNVAVAGYRVRRDGKLIKTLGPGATSFSDSSLAPATYQYAVLAFDAAGNVGAAMTASVTVSAADTTRPSTPTRFTGEALGSRRVSLTWRASTDDRAGTIRYRIKRDGIRIATVTTRSYVDRPSLGRHYYKVRAIDAAGNKSPWTPIISVRAVR
jgi:fibronectin type 3 domain-containing protein